MMKTLKVLSFWGVVVLLFGVVAWICFKCLPSSPFRDNFLGDGLATIIGAIFGIPIALWLSAKQQKEQERLEQKSRDREALERKAKVLRLVSEELEHNRKHIMESREVSNGAVERKVGLGGFKNELWMAFSDGGELEWIKDLQLLHFISQAYHYIRMASYLEELYLQYHYYPGTYVLPRREEGLLEELVRLDETVLESIEKALEEVTTGLVGLDNAEQAESVAAKAA